MKKSIKINERNNKVDIKAKNLNVGEAIYLLLDSAVNISITNDVTKKELLDIVKKIYEEYMKVIANGE